MISEFISIVVLFIRRASTHDAIVCQSVNRNVPQPNVCCLLHIFFFAIYKFLIRTSYDIITFRARNGLLTCVTENSRQSEDQCKMIFFLLALNTHTCLCSTFTFQHIPFSYDDSSNDLFIFFFFSCTHFRRFFCSSRCFSWMTTFICNNYDQIFYGFFFSKENQIEQNKTYLTGM